MPPRRGAPTGAYAPGQKYKMQEVDSRAIFSWYPAREGSRTFSRYKMISSTAVSSLVAILLLEGGPGLTLGHHVGFWPVFEHPSPPTLAALVALNNPSTLNMKALKNPSSANLAVPMTPSALNKSEFLVRLLRREKRNNSVEDTGYSMGYGMSMVADLLGHRNDIDRDADAIEEHRNQKTNLNIPEQAIIRSL